MSESLEIVLYIAIPLAYGMFIEFLFEMVRNIRARRGKGQERQP